MLVEGVAQALSSAASSSSRPKKYWPVDGNALRSNLEEAMRRHFGSAERCRDDNQLVDLLGIAAKSLSIWYSEPAAISRPSWAHLDIGSRWTLLPGQGRRKNRDDSEALLDVGQGMAHLLVEDEVRGEKSAEISSTAISCGVERFPYLREPIVTRCSPPIVPDVELVSFASTLSWTELVLPCLVDMAVADEDIGCRPWLKSGRLRSEVDRPRQKAISERR